MDKRKRNVMIMGIFVLVLSMIGFTYAIWSTFFAQEGVNEIGVTCFNISFEEEEDFDGITLQKAHPIKETEGLSLKPYKFTVTNNCQDYASYEVHLEIDQESTLTDYNAIRVYFNNESFLLGEKTEVEKTLDHASTAFSLTKGYLLKGDSISYELRMWVDENAPSDVAGTTFLSQITVTTSYTPEEIVPPTIDLDLAICDNTITATGKGTAVGDKEVNEYAFKIDGQDWTLNDDLTKEFTDLQDGTHEIGFRITDNKGVSSEVKKTVTTPESVTIAGKPIPVVSSCKSDQNISGLYPVEHPEEETAGMDPGWRQTEYRYAGATPNNYVDLGERYSESLYLFSYRQARGDYFYSEEACKNDQVEYLPGFGEGAEATECTATPNPEESYFIEYKYSEDDEDVTPEFFEDNARCQSTVEYYIYDGYEIITDCTKLEEHYSYEIIYQDDPENNYFSSEDECTSANEDMIQNGDGICRSIYEAGEPILWRIIGMVNVKTTSGVKQRLKIIRADSIGNKSWDFDNVNDWTKASLMTELNQGAFYTTTLNATAKGMIATDIIWNLGGTASYTSSSDGLVTHWYEYERGTTVYNSGPLEWSPGKESIALPYPSDYGYATSGGSKGRVACLAEEIYNWDHMTNCRNNNWLKPANGTMWTLSPYSSSDRVVFIVYSGGYPDLTSADNISDLWPALYLSSKVSISDGTGEKSSPYVLSIG